MNIVSKTIRAKVHLRSTIDGHIIIDGVIPKENAKELFGKNDVECIIQLSMMVLDQNVEIENEPSLGGFSVRVHPFI
ncbi:hypothetical protein [Runella salmonicolor]|uniref:Uncharacterized protein n=1 Tax=Runella salmonicolor TaxID=2950278 RepID=A0ABT1FST4_9BACT|nr:hypothetical protein [Runella salmonicolor]MCP1384833.1 hypothetical protein [Runella salmonicolor]